MSDYRQRADLYRSEFTFQSDFALVASLCGERIGQILDIPCGSGRLMPVYADITAQVDLVDVEPQMVRSCADEIEKNGLASRLTATVGELTSWRGHAPYDLAIVARGGLQMLRNLEEVGRALQNLRDNLMTGAVVYIDVHDPWARSMDVESLPVFLRFASADAIRGVTRHALPNGATLQREFASVLMADDAEVHFKYSVLSASGEAVRHYEATGHWLNLSPKNLRAIASATGYDMEEEYSDYNACPWNPGASRLITLLRAG